ncbi:hypothetical protein LIA77_11520 [Sarocladium implicatum]|nr:hypothetical protein LIA77_11520 [Sarocladium implicatum]
MFSAAALALLLFFAQLCATIEITNQDFNVQRGVGFEVKWKDADDANVVDINLWEFPVYRYVETLSRVWSGSSKTVFVPEDIEPRDYCFRVVRWPAGEDDFSDGFFFNGTGERESETSTAPGSTATEATTTSETNAPSDTGLPKDHPDHPDNGGDNNGGGRNGTYDPLITRRNPISPMVIALAVVGGIVGICIVAGCIYFSIRSKKKNKNKGAEEAEGASKDTTLPNAPEPEGPSQPEVAEASGSGTEKEIREFYAPVADERSKGQGVKEYYASGALGDGDRDNAPRSWRQ